MANNRLYIVDTETGDKFLLAKSSADGWYVYTLNESGESDPTNFVQKLNEFLDLIDTAAAYDLTDGNTTLVLVAENDKEDD